MHRSYGDTPVARLATKAQSNKDQKMADFPKHTRASPDRAHTNAGGHHGNHHRSALEAEELAKAKRAAAIRQLHQHLTDKGPRYRRGNVLGDGESIESGSSKSGSDDDGGVDDDVDNYFHHDKDAAGGRGRDVNEDDDGIVVDDDDSVSVLSMFTKKYEDIVGPDKCGHDEDSDSESPTPRRPPRRISVITKMKSVSSKIDEDDGLSDESGEDMKHREEGHGRRRGQGEGLAGFLKLAHEEDPRHGSAGSLSYDEIIGNEHFLAPHDDIDAKEGKKTPDILVDFQAKAGDRVPRRRRRRSYQEEEDDNDDKAKNLGRDTEKELKELEEELTLLRKQREMRSGKSHHQRGDANEKKQNDKDQSPPATRWESTRGHSGLARRRATRRSSRLLRDSSNERSDILNAALHDSAISADGSESDFPGADGDASNGNLSTGDLSGHITAGLEELRRRMATANTKTKQDPGSASASEVQADPNTARRSSITRRGRRRSGSGIIRHFSSRLDAECSGDEIDNSGLSGPLKGRISKESMDSLRSMDSVEEEALETKSVGEIMEDFPRASYEVYDLKGSDEEGPRCQPRRSSRRKSSWVESDDESVNSRSSMASNAFSAVLSLAEELMINPDDTPDEARSVDLPTMPEKSRLRRNRSVASASSVGPEGVDTKQNKRKSSFDAAALGDLLVGKSNYLKAVEMEEEVLHGGVGQEDFHASMLLWDANKSSKTTKSSESKEERHKDHGHHFSGYLNDCIPEMDGELPFKDSNSISVVADRSARSIQRAKSADAFPSRRRKSRRRKSRDSSGVHSVGSLNTAESLDLSSEIAEKSMYMEGCEEAPADLPGGPRKSILRHMSSLSLESLAIESKDVGLELNDEVLDETRSTSKHRSGRNRSSISSIPSVGLGALGDEMEAEGKEADKGKGVIGSSGHQASSRASISSIPSALLSALENEKKDDANPTTLDMAYGDDVQPNPPTNSRPQRPQQSRSSSFASVPSVVLDTLQNELAPEGLVNAPPERPVRNRDKNLISQPSSLRDVQASNKAEISIQPSEDSTPEMVTETKIKRQDTRKGSLNALLGLLPNLEDELDEETDDVSPSTKPQGGREIRKALSFDKLKAMMNDSLTKVDSDDNNNNSNSNFDRPAGRPRERSSSFGRLADIMGDLVRDDTDSPLTKAPTAPSNKGMLACMDSSRAFDYNHESSIMAAMGREAPAHYNTRAVAEEEERRRRLSAGKAGFGGMFQSMMANLGSEEAE